MGDIRNTKSDLIRDVQRLIGRSLTKDDVVYTVVEVDGQFQATVRLNCYNSDEFVGEVADSDRDAQNNAAQQALDAYADQIAALPPVKNKRQKEAEKKAAKLAGIELPKVLDPNLKSQLVQALQGHASRALTKGDITYESVQVDNLFQSTITLHCLQGMAYVGEPATSEKAARENADAQAIRGQSQWVSPSSTPPPHVEQARQRPKEPEAPHPKTDLIIFLQGYTKRTMQKGDITYTHVEGDGLTQATVTLNCLNGQAFAGEPLSSPKAAENSAAIECLRAWDREVWQVKQNIKGPSNPLNNGRDQRRDQRDDRRDRNPKRDRDLFGRGSDRGSDRGSANNTPLGGGYDGGPPSKRGVPPGRPGSFTGVLPARDGGSRDRGGGGSGGSRERGGGGRAPTLGRSDPPTEDRSTLSDPAALGEVSEWNTRECWGNLRPHNKIDHPAADKDGKLYIHNKDITNAASLAPGSLVQFRIYQDAKGLGACEVILF